MKERVELQAYLRSLDANVKAKLFDQVLNFWPPESNKPEAVRFWQAMGELCF